MSAILDVFCTIERNRLIDGYTAVEGIQTMELSVNGEVVAIVDHSHVLWCGEGSPYPTPPGGPWTTAYISAHPKFGQCFRVNSDREGDVFIHFGSKSYGCFMLPKNDDGKAFLLKLIEHRAGLVVVQNEVEDARSDEEIDKNPIDYSKMTKFIS